MKGNVLILILILLITAFNSCREKSQKVEIVYKIMNQDGRWLLTQNEAPYYIKGAVARNYFDKLKSYGGNSVRIWRDYESRLDSAQKYGLTVMVSLPVSAERYGMDWNDTAMVEENIEEVMAVVRQFKDHPSVMLWALGNELDWIPPGVPYNPKLWDWIELTAQKIKAIDQNHPVMTVVGSSDFEKKVKEMARQCPSLDLIGLNLYGDFTDETKIIREHWKKPYAVTEWGPHGHWQQPYTEWKAPMEQSSSEKAASYEHNYTQVIQKDQTHGLGSYVFLWGQKQEITHTWYGMFSVDGLASESVNVMHELWSEKTPPNTAPKLKELLINGQERQLNFYLKTGQNCTATLQAEDAEDQLTYHWEIKKEVDPAPYAGQGEIPAEPIPGLIDDPSKAEITFTAPQETGAYRLFGYAFDGQGHWAYANFPFYCR
jgi:beta-galactosidase/beta-glucuronidase